MGSDLKTNPLPVPGSVVDDERKKTSLKTPDLPYFVFSNGKLLVLGIIIGLSIISLGLTVYPLIIYFERKEWQVGVEDYEEIDFKIDKKKFDTVKYLILASFIVTCLGFIISIINCFITKQNKMYGDADTKLTQDQMGGGIGRSEFNDDYINYNKK